MKKLIRFMMGFISSVLLSAGFSRAADKLDLIDSNQPGPNRTIAPSPGCGTICNLLDEHN